MFQHTIIILLILVVVLSLLPTHSQIIQPSTGNARYIIIMKENVTPPEMEEVMEAMEIMTESNRIAMEMNQTTALIPMIHAFINPEAVDMANSLEFVVVVEMDMMVYTAIIEDPLQQILSPVNIGVGGASNPDSLFLTDRYNLDVIDQGCSEMNNGEYMPNYSGVGVDIYIFDTGINYEHEDYGYQDGRSGTRARYAGYDAIDDLKKENRQGRDCNGHGSHCAGIAGGLKSGVAKDANLYSLRVLGCNSGGSFTAIIRGADYVYQQHLRNLARSDYRGSVVSMSLAGPVSVATNMAINALTERGVVAVSASGNFRREACNYSPGSTTNIINVGAHYYVEEGRDVSIRGIRDVYWFFSRSNSPGMNYGRCVDIIAPGQYVHSVAYRTSAGFTSMSGTSMACPHVAGASALLLQRFPRDSPASIKNRLTSGCCRDLDFRRMPSSIRQTNPNCRLRVELGGIIPIPVTTPPTAAATTTTTTTTTTTIATTATTTTTTTPEPTIPTVCMDLCPFSLLTSSTIVELSTSSLPTPERFAYFLRAYRGLRFVLYKSSSSIGPNGNYIYHLLMVKSSDTSRHRYIFSRDNNNRGVIFEDIETAIAENNAQNTVKLKLVYLIPTVNSKYFLVLGPLNCPDVTYEILLYTNHPTELNSRSSEIITAGQESTFAIMHGVTQIGTRSLVLLKAERDANCDCFAYTLNPNRINLLVDQLEPLNYYVEGINSYNVGNARFYTALICDIQCLGRNNGCPRVRGFKILTDIDGRKNFKRFIDANIRLDEHLTSYTQQNEPRYTGVFLNLQ